jgi:hypothetical protein
MYDYEDMFGMLENLLSVTAAQRSRRVDAWRVVLGQQVRSGGLSGASGTLERADAEDETRLETERQIAAEGDHYER